MTTPAPENSQIFSVARSLCDLQNDHIPVRLCNHTNNLILLLIGTPIANLQHIQSITPMSDDESSARLTDNQLQQLKSTIQLGEDLTPDQREGDKNLVAHNASVFGGFGRPANMTSALPPFQIHLSDGSPVC